MFENLKIVELASVLAGPLTGTFFSELGAKVIKIENRKTKGDVTRSWKLPHESKANSISAYYCAANYNKESILLDLSTPNDYQKVIGHIKEADIVIANFKPRTAQKLRLSYQDLINYNPNIIYAELTGFGTEDSRPAFDVVLQAETGFMYMNGEANRNPVKMPVALIDVLAAHHLKEAILVALINKMKTDEGKHIKVSLFESALASLANQATNWLMEGHVPQPLGTQHPNIAPYGDMHKTSDGKLLVLAIGSDRQFKDLCKVLEINILGFESNADRLKRRTELNKIIDKIIALKPSSYWIKHFENIPYGMVKNMQEVFADQKTKTMLLTETIEGVETIRVKTALL